MFLNLPQTFLALKGSQSYGIRHGNLQACGTANRPPQRILHDWGDNRMEDCPFYADTEV